jgi:hypothetical protein
MRPDGCHHAAVGIPFRLDAPGIPFAGNQLGQGHGNLNITRLGKTAIHKTLFLSWLLD